MSPDHLLEQALWDTFWVPPQTTVSDQPNLLYTTHPSDNPTLNVALRTRGTAQTLPAMLHTVRQAHHGRRSRVMVNPQNRSTALHTALQVAGYQPCDNHDAYVITTESKRAPIRDGLVVHRVETMQQLHDAISVANQAFGREDRPDEATCKTYLAACQKPGGRVHRFVVYDRTATPLATAGMTLFPRLRFGFFWGGGTTPAGRGRGAYSALVTARMHGARRSGIDMVGLYARLETSAPIVAAQGFSRHGRMTNWECPAGTT